MNTSSIFYPSLRMGKTLREFQNEGATRVEISYYADSVEAEDWLLNESFPDKAKDDLERVFGIINKTAGLCYNLRMLDFFQTFEEVTKMAQLFV